MRTIGIQGGKGSFSENAAQKFIIDHGLKDTSIKYLISSEIVLSSVENGSVDFGVIAM